MTGARLTAVNCRAIFKCGYVAGGGIVESEVSQLADTDTLVTTTAFI